MKTKNLFILTALAVSALLTGCSPDNESAAVSNEQITISADTKAGIQNFIDQVNGVTTRAGSTNPDPPLLKMRIYISGRSDCDEGNGYCLPEVIVTPGIQKPWIQTPEGWKLQEMVNNGQITVRKEYSPVSNTEFYIYNGVENKNAEIVVPVAYK